MSIIFPEGIKARGKLKLKLVMAIANSSAPALATEINNATSLDISCFTYADSWTPALEQNKGEAPLRLCTSVTIDQFGNSKYTLPDLQYVVDPQGAALSNNVKAWETITPGLTAFLVERQGLDAQTSVFAVGQFVNVWPVQFGPSRLISGDTTDEFAEFMVTQPVRVAAPGTPTLRVAVVA